MTETKQVASIPPLILSKLLARLEIPAPLAALQEACAFAEMTDHRFLDDTRRRQETTFSNGVVVRADFDAKTAEVVYPKK